MKGLVFLFIFIFALSCAPEGEPSKADESNKYPSPYIPASPVTYDADIQAYALVSFSLNAENSYFSNLPAATGSWEYSLVNEPSWLSINTSSGLLSGIPEGQGVEEFSIHVVDSGDNNNSQTVNLSIAVNSDPLFFQQWYLNNTAQDSFALSGGDGVSDINLASVIQSGLSGKGVKIAISDSGGEINHDDLYENIIDNASRDYTLASPYLGNPVATSAHGTAVAGIIGARGWNNIGMSGVAPKASMAIFQFLKSSQSTSLLINQASGDFDVFNYSYGDTLFYDTSSDPDYLDHLRYQYTNGRNGKGILYTKAAGNEYILYDDIDSPTYCASHNANLPFENESPFLIVVGAINAQGVRASYSNTGSNIWVSAPGGEYGFNYPAMLSTDLPTCFKGYSKAQDYLYNDFEYGHDLNKKCNYTSTMNGTSSAAPVISGAIALILEANPDLTAREVKHILAVSSKKVDSSFNNNDYGTDHPSYSEVGCPNLNLTGHTYEQGWITNNAGVDFNNAYGFGLVDIDQAVSIANDFSQDPLSMLPLGDLVETNPYFNKSGSNYRRASFSKSIPDEDKAGVSDNLTFSDSLTIESVQVKVQIQHPRSGDIGIELTSPNGTKSILLNINNSLLFDGDSNLNVVLTTHAFYGESANGTWTIKVIDGLEGSTGELKQWDLNILGHN